MEPRPVEPEVGCAPPDDGEATRATSSSQGWADPADDQSRPLGRVTRREVVLLAVAGGLVVLLGGAAALLTAKWPALCAVANGERDLRGRFRYEPGQPVDPQALASMDMERVHGRLFPSWVAAAARWLDDPGAEQRAFRELEQAIAPDPNLSALAGEMRRIVLLGGVLPEAERMQYLAWAWTSYLDQQGYPYIVDGRVGVSRGRRPFFYAFTYRTLDDEVVTVGSVQSRVRLAWRMDSMTLRELHVGGVRRPESGAVVLLDQVGRLASDTVWPLLGETEPADRDELGAVFAGPVSAEVVRAIPREHFETLSQTATSRARLVAVARTINEREPCTGFAIYRIPVTGFDRRDLEQLAREAVRSIGSECPVVTVDEVLDLWKHSVALRADLHIEQAVASLTLWLARTVAVHEARHLADANTVGIDGLECESCAGQDVAAEVSAYLATFAWGEAPLSAFYQACRAVRSGTNPHAAAMETILEGLGRECVEGPPPGLRGRARGLESRLLGRSEAVEVPRGFPRVARFGP